ncbi:MAG: hypothetical protein KAQ67_10065, partial [Gammaproteobacteria bacterium]|nr:hypothetical protein [Gammaproteobacteria bacterium]
MRALIKAITLLFVITSFNTAKADMLFDIDEAMVSKNWIKADRLLQKLSNKYNNPAITFKVLASRSWVAAKQGNWRKARKLVNSARNSAVSKDQEDIAALNDTDLAIRLSNVKGLPSLHERIVIGGAKDRFGAKIKKSGKDVYKVINTEVSSLLKGFMAVEKAMVPFSVPVPPKLEKGEFEKTNDFLNRVGIAEKKYKKRIDIIKKDFQSRIDKKQKEIEIKGKQLPEMRRFYTQWIMNAAFGQPKITRLKYDADLEVFRAQVVVKNGFGEVLKHNVAIDVPIEKAKHT